jgi:hypothetical protein
LFGLSEEDKTSLLEVELTTLFSKEEATPSEVVVAFIEAPSESPLAEALSPLKVIVVE